MRFELTTSSLGSCTPPNSNPLGNKDLATSENQGMPQSMPCGHENDTELAYLVQVWADLPVHIKRAIKALIDTVKESTK